MAFFQPVSDVPQIQRRGAKPARMARVSALPGRASIDASLMGRVRDHQDRAAHDELARHYAPRLKSWLLHRGEQEQTAEDIVQDVLITVWIKAALFDSRKASFSTWIFRATRNRWLDHKRKHDRMTPTDPEVMSTLADSVEAGADEEYDKTETAKLVRRELAELSADHRHMLYLAFYEGLSHSEIATRTGIALGTVKSRIRAPLKKLREKLEDFHGDGNE